MEVVIKRMNQTLIPDFYELHSLANESGWCFCAAWWVKNWPEFSANTANQNRSIREALFQRGEHDGYLAYADGVVAGWIQVGIRGRLEKLVAQYDLREDDGVWAITCMLIAPKYRKRGIARVMIKSVIADLSLHRVKRVMAFPRNKADLEDGEAWTGPLKLYEEMGFQITGGQTEWPIMELKL